MRNPLIISYSALIVIESIWWFSALAVFGGVTGLGGSPIPWFALLLLFGVGAGTAWVFGGTKSDAVTAAIYQGVIALVAVYLTVAVGTTGDSFSFKIAWPIDMFGGTYGGQGATDLIIALITSGMIWYRSQGIIAGGGIARRMSRGFKVGTGVIAIALLVQLGIDLDIGISPMLVPFFGASLIGMAASRLPQTADAGQASWPKVIAISVGGIVGIGVIGGMLTGRYGGTGVKGIFALWGMFVDALLWVLRYPIEWIMNALWALILWAQSLVGEQEEVDEEVGERALSEPMENPALDRAEEATNFAVDALRWPLSILLLIVVFLILVFAYKRFVQKKVGDSDTSRESIRGDADATADMMKLLSSLVPSWMKGGKKRSLWKWPEGEKGVAETFLLYFDTLTHAIKRGMVFDPNVTPNERVSALAVFLPGAPIDVITNRFNAACYGAEPTDDAVIERLRVAVEEAADKPKPSETD
jgi:hypothetical protein